MVQELTRYYERLNYKVHQQMHYSIVDALFLLLAPTCLGVIISPSAYVVVSI
jgi:hypothetical protein